MHDFESYPFRLRPRPWIWRQRTRAGFVWASHVGGTCVPDSATIRAGQYETAGFGVRFGGNSVGHIRLLCPFGQDGYGATIGAMEMSVIDQDGMEAGGRIRAHLHRAAKGTNIWIKIATCDSNTSNTTTPHQIICPLSFTITDQEWYLVDVEIERTTPSVNVESPWHIAAVSSIGKEGPAHRTDHLNRRCVTSAAAFSSSGSWNDGSSVSAGQLFSAETDVDR